MKPIHRTAVCTLLFLFALGTAFAQQVKTDFDHQANFAQYKTYSWQDVKVKDPLWDSRIKNAVDAQLQTKGLTRVRPFVCNWASTAFLILESQRGSLTFTSCQE